MKSYFIEGIQGAGKSTYVQYLEKRILKEAFRGHFQWIKDRERIFG